MLLSRTYKRGKKLDRIEGPLSISPTENIWGRMYQKVKRKVLSYEHIVLDTDYENYAVTYGCDNYFGLWHGRWATFLTRNDYA